MQHDVDAARRVEAHGPVSDVTFDEAKCERRVRAPTAAEHVREVGSASRREVVEPDDFLTQPEQRFDQMRADESSCSGDQKALWLETKPRADLVVASHLT